MYNSEVEVPIAEDTLQVNMGIPIIVFVNKSDLILSLIPLASLNAFVLVRCWPGYVSSSL